MKKVLMILVGLMFLATPCFGETVYVPVTSDNVVENVKSVVVKATEQKEIATHYTLEQLSNMITTVEWQITELQARKAELLVIKTAVEVEAKKVKLKAK